MSDHTRALVPIDCWMYCSPDLFEKNRTVDVGLLAEALIYYEQVLVNVSNPLQLAELVRWFIRHGVYREFVSLIQEGTIQIYNYAFYTLCFVDEVITLLNITDEVMEKPNSFPKRFLENKEFRNAFSTHKQYSEFCNTVNGRVIEVKATEFGDAGVQNASRDCLDPRRSTVILQALLDELYKMKSLGRPPIVQTIVQPTPDGEKHNITWNIDFDKLSKLAFSNLKVSPTDPFSAAANSNRHI